MFYSFYFRAAPVTCGSSWVRGCIKLPLQAHATATAPLNLSCICNLLHSFWQCQSLTHWARTGIEPASSWTLSQVLNPLSHNRNSYRIFFFFNVKETSVRCISILCQIICLMGFLCILIHDNFITTSPILYERTKAHKVYIICPNSTSH